MIIHSNKEEFKKDISNSEKPILVDFFATWCAPCQMIGKVLEQLTNEDSFDIVKIDIDKDQDLAIEYNVEAVPTLVLFKDGKELDRTMGFLSKTELIDFIEKHK